MPKHSPTSSSLHACRRPRLMLAAAGTVVALAALLPAAASAQDSPNACGDGTAILKGAYPAAKPESNADYPSWQLGDRRLMLPRADAGYVPAMVCKIWPAHDTLLLVAVPRMDAKESLETDRVGDLDILVVDRASQKTLQRMTLPDAMTDDAVRIERIEFDTARYVVAPGVQAFGLRIHHNGASRVNPFSETTLRLFTMQNGASGPLRMVLDKLVVSRGTGEWDGRCAGTFAERNATLAMDNASHAGFADIRVSVTGEDTKNTPVGNQADGDCKDTITKVPRAQHTLRYDGKRYVVPDALKAL